MDRAPTWFDKPSPFLSNPVLINNLLISFVDIMQISLKHIIGQKWSYGENLGVAAFLSESFLRLFETIIATIPFCRYMSLIHRSLPPALEHNQIYRLSRCF